jgi:hypothetical protein
MASLVFPTNTRALYAVGRPRVSYQQNVVRTPMETGPDKVRRRSSAAPRIWTLSSNMLSTSEMIVISTFFDTTTHSGSLPFDMPDPITGATEEFRFAGPFEAE